MLLASMEAREKALAKINLGLAVRRRRPDGYHELHTVFATVSLADALRLKATPRGIQLSINGGQVPKGAANLAWRAAERYLEAAGWPGGVAIELEKRIPVAAGLGGGSADAAAVLRGLRRIYPAPVDLRALALGLGADVPFLLEGGLAEAEGIGERTKGLAPIGGHFVLLKPPFALETRAVYAALVPNDHGPPLPVAAIIEALAQGRCPPWRNDLEKAAFRLKPELLRIRQALEAEGLCPLLSGSGPTFIVPQTETDLADRLRERFPGFWIQTVHLEKG